MPDMTSFEQPGTLTGAHSTWQIVLCHDSRPFVLELDLQPPFSSVLDIVRTVRGQPTRPDQQTEEVFVRKQSKLCKEIRWSQLDCWFLRLKGSELLQL